MKRLALLLAVAALALPISAEPVEPAVTSECSEPPCGYILPQMDIRVTDKMICGGGYLLYAEEVPDDCYDLLADGESRTFEAKLIWFWELSEDGTYPKETGTEIYITFSGTATNPEWLSSSVDGPEMEDGRFVITDADLVNPDYIQQRPNAQGSDAVYFWYEKDITITFERDGSPSGKEVKKLADGHAIQKFFLKAKSSESGPRFKEAFAVEEFRFNTCTDDEIAAKVAFCPAPEGTVAGADDDRDAPGLPIIGLLAALAIAFVRRR